MSLPLTKEEAALLDSGMSPEDIYAQRRTRETLEVRRAEWAPSLLHTTRLRVRIDPDCKEVLLLSPQQRRVAFAITNEDDHEVELRFGEEGESYLRLGPGQTFTGDYSYKGAVTARIRPRDLATRRVYLSIETVERQ